jgi:hypothetical protein
LENLKLAEALEAIDVVRILLHPQFNLTPCFPFECLREKDLEIHKLAEALEAKNKELDKVLQTIN